jgi:hypothetical protein
VVGPRTFLDGCGKSRPPPPLQWDSILRLPSAWRFFIGVMVIIIIGVDLSFKYHNMFEKLFLVPSDELWSANF